MSSRIDGIYTGKGKYLYRVYFRGVLVGECENLYDASEKITILMEELK